MDHKAAIDYARSVLASAKAKRGALLSEMSADFPRPSESVKHEEWIAWMEAYECNYQERGGYELDHHQHASEDALIEAVRASLLAEGSEAGWMFSASLGESDSLNYERYRKLVLEICMKHNARQA